MNDCLVIVPTRGRKDRIQYFYQHFIENSINSDIILVCDNDDEKYPKLDKVQYTTLPKMTVPEKINVIANKEANNYKYLSFLGDDHIPKSHAWDQKLMNTIPEFGIAYGNDLYQGENLPTVCIITSNIVKCLGYMAIPTVKHFYIDNAWKEWGMATNSLKYSDNVIIEHFHPAAGKADSDETYNITSEYTSHDYMAYKQYRENRLSTDIMKLSTMMATL